MKIYKAKEFCEELSISLKTLERLEKKGVIVPIRKNSRTSE